MLSVVAQDLIGVLQDTNIDVVALLEMLESFLCLVFPLLLFDHYSFKYIFC